MKTVRFALSVVLVLLLGGGYAVSQLAFHQGWAPDYAAKVDSGAIPLAATLLLAIVLVLGWVRDEEPAS